MSAAVTVAHYTDKNGRDRFQEWTSGLRDYVAQDAIFRRIAKLKEGAYGAAGPLRDGVWELKVDIGPGYRVYYARDGLTVVLLLCGGDKRRQSADIDRAVGYWKDWQARKKEKASGILAGPQDSALGRGRKKGGMA